MDANQPAPAQPGEKYKRVEKSLGKMLLHNFLGGIAWSFGTFIGLGLLVLFISYFVSRIDFVPIIGDWVARILEEAATRVAPQVPGTLPTR